MPSRHEHPASRLEALSDGIFAIIMTITVIEMKVPVGTSLSALVPIWPVMLSFVSSFTFLVIYWNNHHHMLKHVHEPTAGIMWANAHLLFWLSLVLFATIWLGQNAGTLWPTVFYGTLLLLSGVAYSILQDLIVSAHGPDSSLARSVGSNFKGKVSLIVYVLAIAAAFISPWISYIFYGLLPLLWIVPDRRFKVGDGE